jgi:hypothetical protein
MRRLALLAIFASSVLQATSFTSASCGWGSTSQTVTNPTSSSCSIPIIIDGNYLGFAGASADVTGSLSETGLLGVEGSGGIEFSGSSLPGGGGGSGEATYSQTFATAGPVRLGFVSAVISGFGGYWNASVSEDGYPYGPSEQSDGAFRTRGQIPGVSHRKWRRRLVTRVPLQL